MKIEALRTPDERFADLPDFPYEPHYVDDLPGYPGLRMAYIDEGPRDAEVFLCLHGEPTWSFLYRKMIPVLLEAGKRVVAPDMFGFGRSDKPVSKETHTYSFHRQSLLNLIERLDLRNITLVCQDWGGVLGLTLPIEHATRYARLLVMDTALPLEPETTRLAEDVFSGGEPKTGFGKWRALAASATDMPVGQIVNQGSGGALSEAEIAAYDAPFPDASYKVAPHVFPLLVPLKPEMDGYMLGQRAAEYWNRWNKPAFMAVGPNDQVIPPKAMERLRHEIKGCSAPYHVEGAHHFVQERGEDVARAALDYFAETG
ncbi:haloalkane dehalogenase [Parvularcula oceani]|uniref:haloalkane dehalogenase n=1 Tax=Parvularcula oceani TaxID=1247963 RepID=UPI0004E1A16F|nr:haloalkane dehalogenase [Parvularcula oceani]